MPINLAQCYDPGLKLPDIAAEIVKLPDHTHPDANLRVVQFCMRWLQEYLGVEDGETNAVMRRMSELVAQSRTSSGTILAAMGGRHHDYQTDAFAVYCAAEIQGTASMAREIMFQKAQNTRDAKSHTAADFGTGTGILLGAGLLQGLRQGKTAVTGYGFDSQSKCVTNAQRVLDLMTGTRSQVELANITDAATYDVFRDVPALRVGIGGGMTEATKAVPVDAWISETVSEMTPPMVIYQGQLLDGGSWLTEWLLKGSDPFPTVLQKLLGLKQFLKNMKGGRATMFPNLISGDYMPTGESGWIRLHTDPRKEHIPLSEVGGDLREQFKGSFGGRRW